MSPAFRILILSIFLLVSFLISSRTDSFVPKP